ncbi:Saccharopine dehydrogenase NADP binding domain-containing protein [Micromonospora inyonensis]|uniref:Saccharopine dehydrogenase NADP binding domain-containing protein n=1 Tax=Micromonospora inyonensis TaxID=47866 RepID=A0A1C6RDV8_9ACTN|nr:Saccharopine dehydrogenase NADP binding domain-containing protein [Micromonospora inyonensis]
MRDTTTIGILGGYGAVGSAVARRLHQSTAASLLIAGRDLGRAEELVRSLDTGSALAEPVAVDLADPAALDRFAARCGLLVNCAGPSYRVLDTVARAALHNGTDYVDAAGDDPTFLRLSSGGGAHEWLAAGRIALLSAGALPGLSGLLPRHLANIAGQATRLDAYLGGVAPLTPAAAGDVLLSRGPEHGTPGASWRDGTVRERSLVPRRGLSLAAFPRPVDAFPFLSTEAVRLVRALRLSQVNWYTAFGGDRLPEQLALSWALRDTNTSDLVSAAAEDVRRHGTWYGQEFHLWNGDDAEAPAAVLSLTCDDSYELSGFLAAAATNAVLAGEIPEGVHFAANVLKPTKIFQALSVDPAAKISIDEPAVQLGAVSGLDQIPAAELVIEDGHRPSTDAAVQRGELELATEPHAAVPDVDDRQVGR